MDSTDDTGRPVGPGGVDVSSALRDEETLRLRDLFCTEAGELDAELVLRSGPLRTLYTYAGSAQARTQHLMIGCVRLRAASPATVAWQGRTHEGFLSQGGYRPVHRLCPTCQQLAPEAYRQLVARLLRLTAENLELFGRRLADPLALPEDPAGFSNVHNPLLSAEASLDGLRASGVEVPSELAPLLSRLQAAAADGRRLFSRLTGDVRRGLPEWKLALLAAASAAENTSEYSVDVNRRGRETPALVAWRTTGSKRLSREVEQLFGDWVQFCASTPDADPALWRPDGMQPEDVDSFSPSIEALSSIDRWLVEPSGQSPWQLALDNWRAAVMADMELLRSDWAEHYRWVRSAPDETVTLLVMDRRLNKLERLLMLDRFDMLATVVTAWTPTPTQDPQFWVATVPAQVGRAMHGYTAAGGAVQAAALAGVEDRKLQDVLQLVLGLEESFQEESQRRVWLAKAVDAAVGCLA